MKMECARDLWKAALAGGLAAALCFSAACAGEKGKGQESQAFDDSREAKVVLLIEESAYTNGGFLAYVRLSVGEEAEALSGDALSRLFDRFVEEKILLEAARRQGISLTDDEKRAYLAKISADPDSGVSASAVEMPEGLNDRLLIDKYVFHVLKGIDVSRAEIREYYNGHKKDFLLAERVQVSQILYDTEEKAIGALRRLADATPEEFRLTAREESIGPEAAKDGLMGVYKPGDLPADMEKVIFALPEGKLSQVVESSYGFHIFRVDKKLFPHLRSEEEAAPEIRLKVLDTKRKDALAAHLEELKNILRWKVSYDELTFSYQRLDG